MRFCIFVFVTGFVQLRVVYKSNRPVSNLNATSIGANATKVATYLPKKGRHCLIGVGTKWTIAHLSVRSNSKIERDLRLTGYCVVDQNSFWRPVLQWDSTEIWWRCWCFWLSSNPLSPMRGGQRPNIDKGLPHVDLRQRIVVSITKSYFEVVPSYQTGFGNGRSCQELIRF